MQVFGAGAVPDYNSAEIIPFPARAPRPSDQDRRDADRLARALAGLDAALTEQRVAMAAWCNSLAALRDSTGRLGGSLARFGANLESLESDVTALTAQAHALEHWADTVIAEPADGIVRGAGATPAG